MSSLLRLESQGFVGRPSHAAFPWTAARRLSLGCDTAVLEGLGGESRDGEVQAEGEASLGTALRWLK